MTNRFDDYTGYAYTDRPVYRPRPCQVSFKGIVRVTQQGNTNQIPKLKNISVEVTGPEDKKMYQKSLDLDAFGSLAGDFTLPQGRSPRHLPDRPAHTGETQAGRIV